jgi:hypothetical protein
MWKMIRKESKNKKWSQNVGPVLVYTGTGDLHKEGTEATTKCIYWSPKSVKKNQISINKNNTPLTVLHCI